MGLAERCHERAERTRVAARWLSMRRLWHLQDDLPSTLQAMKNLREATEVRPSLFRGLATSRKRVR